MAAVIGLGVIDDDQMLLDGMAAWLREVPDLRVLRTARTVSGFLLDGHGAGPRPEVVLLDLNLRDQSAPADNVARLRAHGHRVLMVSAIAEPGHVIATIEAGAAGYITKDHDLAALADAARQVAGGAPAITPELAFILSQDRRPARPALSPQEQAVLGAYARGSTLQAAARQAGVAYGTARAYLERVKNKYSQAGRPARTKLELADRLREDLAGLDAPGAWD
jgi:two-component system, NarL family, nitrate/nitrite response regulator NarL